MNESRLVFGAAALALAEGRRAALATVIGTTGSTYRKAGARLLIEGSGSLIGSISAGCLEADIAMVAQEVLREERPRLVTYNTDDRAPWSLDVGCGGTIELFVQPIGEPMKRIADALAARRPIVMELRIDGMEAGATLIVEADRQAPTAARRRIEHDDGGHIYKEALWPEPLLWIFGADSDSKPIVQLAAQGGFSPIVVDHRSLDPADWPDAERLLSLPPHAAGWQPSIGADDFILIKTHHYDRDRDLLAVALRSPARYIGQIGPRTRTERLLADLRQRGEPIPSLRRLHAPVGLDIGSETPEQIAISIVAELLAVLHGK